MANQAAVVVLRQLRQPRQRRRQRRRTEEGSEQEEVEESDGRLASRRLYSPELISIPEPPELQDPPAKLTSLPRLEIKRPGWTA